jgi:hypothetical protein
MLANEGLQEAQALDRKLEQAPRIVPADLPDQGLLTRRQTKDGLAAAAAGSAVTDLTGLDERDTIAALGEVQGGRTAGDAAADDGHVGLVFAVQRRARESPGAFGRVNIIRGGKGLA